MKRGPKVSLRLDSVFKALKTYGSSSKSLKNCLAENGILEDQFYDHAKEPEISEHYTRAVKARADFFAEEIIEISDDGRNDWMETNDPDNPGYRFNGEHSQRSRLRVDSRKWLMSKINPARFGDKIEVSGQMDVRRIVESPEQLPPGAPCDLK